MLYQLFLVVYFHGNLYRTVLRQSCNVNTEHIDTESTDVFPLMTTFVLNQ